MRHITINMWLGTGTYREQLHQARCGVHRLMQQPRSPGIAKVGSSNPRQVLQLESRHAGDCQFANLPAPPTPGNTFNESLFL